MLPIEHWALNMNEHKQMREKQTNEKQKQKKKFTTTQLEQMQISRVNIFYFFVFFLLLLPLFVSFSSVCSHITLHIAFHCSNVNKLCTLIALDEYYYFLILRMFLFSSPMFNLHVICVFFSSFLLQNGTCDLLFLHIFSSFQ